MKANPLVLTIGLAIAATGIAILFVPGTFESMSMLSRDRRGEAAVRVGNQARLDGDRNPAFLDMLIDLNREYGDSTSEAAAIDDYLAKHPNDLGVLRKAVAYYENMQDNAALTAMLERVVALSKSPADIEKLARIYRLWGQFDKERKLLLANRQAKLSQAMAVRLGEYLLEDNEPGLAIASLEPVVDVPGETRSDARALLFDILVRDGKTAQAAEHAARWVNAGLRPAEQALFVLSLAAAGDDNAARTLASKLPDDPAGRSNLAWELVGEGRLDIARTVVNEWMAHADPATTLKAARLYVEIAGSINEFHSVYQDIHRGLTDGDESGVARAMILTRLLYEIYGYDSIANVRPLLDARQFALQPLLGAALSNEELNPSATRYFLLSTDLARLDPAEALLWAGLAKTNFKVAELADELAARWRSGTLAPALVPFFRETAVRAGMPDPAFGDPRLSSQIFALPGAKGAPG